MSILVTGAAGFIGSHVVDHFLAAGDAVVGIDNFDRFYDQTAKERNLVGARGHDHFTQITGDIRDPAALARVPDGVETVIHLAARAGVRPSIKDPVLYQSVNVEGTVRILELMKSRGARNLLFASSSSVYGANRKVPFSEDDLVEHPISPYAATKRSGELLCHTYHHLFGISVVALRFFTVYGPRQRPDLAIHKFARLIRAGRPIPMYGDGRTERDYTFVSDILCGIQGARRFVEAAGDPVFEIVNLGHNRTVSLADMIRTLGREMGVQPLVQRLPPQPGDVPLTYADVAKAERLFGYRPVTEFRDGIRSFLTWLEGLQGRAAVA
jgi:UDP-glucuronate 4-epimerase